MGNRARVSLCVVDAACARACEPFGMMSGLALTCAFVRSVQATRCFVWQLNHVALQLAAANMLTAMYT